MVEMQYIYPCVDLLTPNKIGHILRFVDHCIPLCPGQVL